MSAIWLHRPSIEELNRPSPTMVSHLGIEFLDIGDDYVKARMPVDHRTHQPFGLLHGGASVALAETLGSIGAFFCINPKTHSAVGLDINANHLRGVKSGWVIGVAKPIHRGKTTHVWEIRISDEADKLVCITRLTMAILENPKTPAAVS
jgi:1,4-dihydroxy-2-naphthoyl-CoA hydrolase